VKNTGTKKPKSRQPSKEPEERPDTPEERPGTAGSTKVNDEDENGGSKTKQWSVRRTWHNCEKLLIKQYGWMYGEYMCFHKLFYENDVDDLVFTVHERDVINVFTYMTLLTVLYNEM